MENLSQPEEVEVEQLSSLHQVTPLSKYLAMALFVILPFLGGYVGYYYAPEKVVEVEKVVYKDSSEQNVDQSQNDEDLQNTEKVFQKDGRFAPDGVMLNDKEMYEQTGLPYITTFSKGYPLYVLGGKDSIADKIYVYDNSTQTYNPLDIDILEVAKESGVNGGISVYGWSTDLRYLGIRSSAYEGLVEGPVYYIDTQNLDEGLIVVPDSFMSTGIDKLISPDRSAILGVKTLANEEEPSLIVSSVQNSLYVFDLDTLKVKSIYIHDGEKYTFQQPGFYGPGFDTNAKWLDDNTVELKISAMENFDVFASGPTEENFKRYNKELETVVVTID